MKKNELFEMALNRDKMKNETDQLGEEGIASYACICRWYFDNMILFNQILTNEEATEEMYNNINLYDEEDNPIDIYQAFLVSGHICDGNEEEARNEAGLLVYWSDIYENYILLVPFCGMSWECIPA